MTQFYKQVKIVTTLRERQVSTEASQNPTIIYEKRNYREEKPKLNKKKDKG